MKKAVSMFLAAALAVGTFAGCGSSADTGSTGSAASTESGSTDSAAADGSVFKIGVSDLQQVQQQFMVPQL